MEERGRESLIERGEGGACRLSSSEKVGGGLIRGGGLTEDSRYTYEGNIAKTDVGNYFF